LKTQDTLNQLKNQERDVRINIILKAAEELFSKKNYDKISMQEIAGAAGISKSSIYTYFPNQESLYIESALRHHHELNNILEKISQTRKNQTLIGDGIFAFIDFISQNDSYLNIMDILFSQENLNSDSAAKIITEMRKTLEIIGSVLKQQGYKGDVKMLSHYIFSSITGIVASYSRNSGRDRDSSIKHMKRMGKILEELITARINANQ